jgi:hypothetical protein
VQESLRSLEHKLSELLRAVQLPRRFFAPPERDGIEAIEGIKNVCAEAARCLDAERTHDGFEWQRWHIAQLLEQTVAYARRDFPLVAAILDEAQSRQYVDILDALANISTRIAPASAGGLLLEPTLLPIAKLGKYGPHNDS